MSILTLQLSCYEKAIEELKSDNKRLLRENKALKEELKVLKENDCSDVSVIIIPYKE